MTPDEINAFIADVYPHLNGTNRDYEVVSVAPGTCAVRLNATERHLRPGNTVSGPCLFTLADIGGYACVLAHVGREALAVTTNLNITFMRKAGPGIVEGRTRLLKLGKSLAMFDIELVAGENEAVIAHATGTYALPPKRAVK
ncbi:PaaI family thioesterase [Tianweitania aestuarii]